MNRQDLERRVYRFAGFADSPASDVATRVQMTLNEWHRRILSLPGMEQLRDGPPITFNSVASTARYALPQVIERVKSISETTNDQLLEMRTLNWYRAVDPDPSTGTPYVWVPAGLFQVSSQPSNTGLWVVSSNVGDTTQTANVQAIRAGGYFHEPAVATLSGTTRVQLGTLTDYIEVVEFNISATAVGTVSLYNASAGGTELARIPIGATVALYQHIYLYPTPSAVITYNIDYTRRILDMGRATDVPLLPEQFHWLLSTAALKEEYELKDDNRWQKKQAELDKGIRDLYAYVQNPKDYVGIPNETQSAQGSNLGPWFPAGRW